MSTLRGLRFCDKCKNSISRGEVHYNYGKKHYCAKCEKKKFPFLKAIAAILIAAVLAVGYGRDSYTQDRIDANAEDIELVAEYVVDLERKVRASFSQVSMWANTVEKRLYELKLSYSDQHAEMTRLLKETKKEIDGLLAAHNSLKKELRGEKVTSENAAAIIASLQERANALEVRLEYVLRNSDVLLEKVIKPTVGIGAHDKNGQHQRGSGVLYKRVEVVDKKTGRKTYRYRGFTAYHVCEDILNYLGQVKMGKRKDDMKFKSFQVYVYKGVGSTPLIRNIELVHPFRYLGPHKPIIDILVFEFEWHEKLPVAELATDAEIDAILKHGRTILTTGVSLTKTPSVYSGIIANPKPANGYGTLFHAYGYYGQSGGPVFDAKTLKVIAVNQRIHVHKGFSPNTNILYGTSLKTLRKYFDITAPKEAKGALK